jgi:hypothetical protein
MHLTPAAIFDSFFLAAIFAASGLVHLSGAGFVRRAYARWRFPPKFHRITGILSLLAAAFLATPVTRIWGAVLAALMTFFAVVTLLNHRQYAYSVPAMLMLAALIPAMLASPV